MVQNNVSTAWRQKKKENKRTSRMRTYYVDKNWHEARTEICHSHKKENDDISLNLCSGYGTKRVRAHTRTSSCRDGARTDVVTTIEQN